mmetsp:Transcript_6798/g.20925  ORF Transcript_6798/g.20925 Transcript_6798/m.20925 type:complete len:242 (-) Transcript_6798:484-1209(-)
MPSPQSGCLSACRQVCLPRQAAPRCLCGCRCRHPRRRPLHRPLLHEWEAPACACVPASSSQQRPASAATAHAPPHRRRLRGHAKCLPRSAAYQLLPAASGIRCWLAATAHRLRRSQHHSSAAGPALGHWRPHLTALRVRAQPPLQVRGASWAARCPPTPLCLPRMQTPPLSPRPAAALQARLMPHDAACSRPAWSRLCQPHLTPTLHPPHACSAGRHPQALRRRRRCEASRQRSLAAAYGA